MAKIHTHYDNLKVARMAPQEVIRAAYKALSQKYHPDKNPGDEKAARIMAIVNTAYTALNDPVRRKEHDEWIAAEEWEVAWLESTHQEEGPRARGNGVPDWQGADGAAAAPHAHGHSRLKRALRRYFALLAAAGVGAAVALGMAFPGRVLPMLGLAAAPQVQAAPVRVPATSRVAEDSWAVAPEHGGAEATKITVLATAGVTIGARTPDCANPLQTQVAPNGEPWPERSGYVASYPIGNPGKQMQLFIDNSANTSPVFVKIYDLDRNANVRHLYILAGDTWNVSQLAAGKYEVRYQDVATGASRAACGENNKGVPENPQSGKDLVHSGT
jgi:hypothetical protein